MKNKAKESWLKWLKDNGARNVRSLKPEEGYADQIHGFINDHYCVGFFKGDYATLTIFGKTYFDFPISELEEKLKTLKEPQDLEIFELREDQEWVITKDQGELLIKLRSKN